jgi:hypothetical protein
MMKAATFLSLTTTLVLVGCGDQKSASNPEPAAPVQGQAIAKLETTPAKVESTASNSSPVEIPTPDSTASPVTVSNAIKSAETSLNVAANTVVTTTNTPTPSGGAPVAKPKMEKTELIDGEFLSIGFDKLSSFEYEVPEEEYDPDKKPNPAAQTNQIPAEVKAFNKQRVALKGFMLPLKVEDGNITELLIMRDQSMCCYGTVPKINEWVSVKMTGKGIKPIMDQAVTIYGRLKVGEIRENGYLVGIYEMDGEKMTGPLDL